VKRIAGGTNPGKYNLMPESVRDAYEQAAVAAWASAQEIAAKSAQETWQARTLVTEKDLAEATAISVGRAADILLLRAQLAECEANASATVAAAQREAENSSRLLAEKSDDAQRAVTYASSMVSRAATLRGALEAAQASAEVLFEEIDAMRMEKSITSDQRERSGVCGSSGTASAQPPDSEESLYAQVSDADLAAAAAIIVEAARRVCATGILDTDLRKSSNSEGRSEVRRSISAGATAARSRPDS
jgi:G:T/U-mismatch repair DNA glycosylase